MAAELVPRPLRSAALRFPKLGGEASPTVVGRDTLRLRTAFSRLRDLVDGELAIAADRRVVRFANARPPTADQHLVVRGFPNGRRLLLRTMDWGCGVR
jgi:hypothetical protein